VRSMRLGVPSRDTIAVDTLLRQSVAAAVAFPSGAMAASELSAVPVDLAMMLVPGGKK
jgi:hypothetical protein